MAGVRADVANFKSDAEANFALDVDGILLHPRRLGLRIDQREVLADAGRRAERVAERSKQARWGTDW